MHPGLLRRVGAPAGPLLLSGALLISLTLFATGGSTYSQLVWIGSAAISVAAGAFVVGLWGALPLPALTRAGYLCAGFLAALVVWMGVSVTWSVAPDLSWNYFNRGLVYLAFLGLGICIGAAVPRAASVAALGLAALSAAVMGWALAGKVVPNLFPDGGRLARLREPVGYWNALGLIAVTAVLLGLWLASRREHRPWLRITGTVLVFAGSVVLLLTLSRGSTATAVIVVAAFVALTRARVPVLAALALGVVPGTAVAAWAFTQDGLTGDKQTYDARLEAGLQFGVLLLVAGAVVALAARWLLRSEDALAGRLRRPTRAQAFALAGAAFVALVLAVVAASGGDPAGWAERAIDDFTSPAAAEETQTPARLGEFSSNSRWDWWREAWDLFEAEPLEGAGAGSFAVARRPLRRSTIDARAPHSVPLQFLAETGLVGFALFFGAAAAAIAACIQAVRRSGDAERAAATVLALSALAYLLHALVDYDWDFVALTGPVLLVVGVLIAAGRPTPAPRRRPLLAGGLALAALVAVFSVVSPWISARKTEDTYEALARGDVPSARDDAEAARSLNPLSLDPLRAEAAVAEAEGKRQDALELYVEAVELQPKNWQSWYDLARFEQSARLFDAALRHATRAGQLDPRNPIIFELINALVAQPEA